MRHLPWGVVVALTAALTDVARFIRGIYPHNTSIYQQPLKWRKGYRGEDLLSIRSGWSNGELRAGRVFGGCCGG